MNEESQDPTKSDDTKSPSSQVLLLGELQGPRLNIILFIATVLSVYVTASLLWGDGAWQFVATLLSILLFHEFGHYFAARLHGVPASLPFFIPLPVLSPFGTLGAVILMDHVKRRRALIDIGAAGPLAGLLVAIPMMFLGVAWSEVKAQVPGLSTVQEGQSLLYAAIKYLVHGPIPAGHDIWLHPVAFAAWAGFLITSLNLLPIGQLDGGHIAHALFGEKYRSTARWVRLAPWALLLFNWLYVAQPIVAEWVAFDHVDHRSATVLSALLPWVIWGGLLRFLPDHPPVEGPPLDYGRRAIGYLSLALFVSLLMPTPLLEVPADPIDAAAMVSAAASAQRVPVKK